MRPLAAALLLFVATLFLVATLGFAAQAWSPLGGLAFTEIVLILGSAVLFVRRRRLPVLAALRWRPVAPRVAWVAAGLGITTWAVAVTIHAAVAPLLGAAPTAATGPPPSIGVLLAALVAGALLAGICEEALFRGAIQGLLERHGQRFAILVTALLFGLFHLTPATIVPAVFLGLVFGFVVARTGSTVTAAIAHTANNATAIISGALLHGHGPMPPTLVVVVFSGGFVVCTLLLVRITRGAVVVASPLATAAPEADGAAAGAGRSPAFRVLRFGAGALLVLLVAAGALAASLATVRSAEWALPPALEQGERAVVVYDRSFQRPIGTGDVVLFRAVDAATEGLGRVVRTDGDRLWIDDGATVAEVGREVVLGKMVYPRGRR